MAERHGNNGMGEPLGVAVRRWPTPTAADARNPGPAREGTRQGSDGLASAAWATPMARDHRSGVVSDEVFEARSRPLSEQVGRTSPGMLNPAWVEALMGFPPGWTSGGQPDEAKDSTRGSRRERSRRSAGPSQPPSKCRSTDAFGSVDDG